MTRVLYLIKTLGRGGAERLLMDVALHLDRSKVSIDIAYVFDEQNDLVGDLEDAGLPVIKLGDRGRHVRWLSSLRRLIRERHYDVLHIHSPYVAAPARLLPRECGVRVLYTEHAEWSAYRRPTRWANMLTYWRNDQVLAVSDQVRESAHYPAYLSFLPRPPIDTLHHGVDLTALRSSSSGEPFPRSAFGIPEDALVVGTVANFRPEKGHRVLLEAADRVRASLPNVHFVLVGGGPTEQATRDQATALGLDGVVTFTGYRDDAAHVGTMFDVFALPSFNEGLPIALIESMALGKPIVATDAGGTPEVLEHERQGLLVPSRDPDALASALVDVLENPETRRRMGHESAMRAADFDIRRAVARLEEIYESAGNCVKPRSRRRSRVHSSGRQ